MRLIAISCLLVLSLGSTKWINVEQEAANIPNGPLGMTVPKEALGWSQGPAESNRTMMVFMDHLCSACAYDWPIISAFFDQSVAWLRVSYHFLPLPYHNNSFLVQQAGRFIQNKYPNLFINYTTWMFENQDQYLGAVNITSAEVRKLVAEGV